MALEFPQIDPIIFSIGPLSVRWYGLMYLIGFAFAMWFANRQASKSGSGWTKDEVSDLLFYGMLGVILGGRIGYVLFYQFSYFIENPLYLFRIDQGGMSFHGGTLGVITAIAIFAYKRKKSLLQVGDFVAPLVPVGLLAGRIGNFINGELYGRATQVWWGMYFPLDASGVLRHPSQLYEAFGEGVVLFLLLWGLRKKARFPGFLLSWYLMGYAIIRFFIEFLREPDLQLGYIICSFTMGQVLCVIMGLMGAGVFLWRRGIAEQPF